MFVVGMILIGVGLGQLLDNSAWIWIGIGAGFVVEGIFGPVREWMGDGARKRRG